MRLIVSMLVAVLAVGCGSGPIVIGTATVTQSSTVSAGGEPRGGVPPAEAPPRPPDPLPPK